MSDPITQPTESTEPVTEDHSLRLVALQAEYDILTKKAGSFDHESMKLRRAKDAELKAFFEARKKDRAALLNEKLKAYNALETFKREHPEAVATPTAGDQLAEPSTQPVAPLTQQQPLVPIGDAPQPPPGAVTDGVVRAPGEPPTQPFAPELQRRPQVPGEEPTPGDLLAGANGDADDGDAGDEGGDGDEHDGDDDDDADEGDDDAHEGDEPGNDEPHADAAKGDAPTAAGRRNKSRRGRGR